MSPKPRPPERVALDNERKQVLDSMNRVKHRLLIGDFTGGEECERRARNTLKLLADRLFIIEGAI